jgi:ABC-type glycerol-3-phosphate transport system permease component
MRSRRISARRLLSLLGLLALLCLALIPIGWTISTAFKSKAESFAVPTRWIPRQPTVGAFVSVWKSQPIGRQLLNSLVVSIATTLVTTVFAALAGYGLSRFPFRGEQMFLRLILVVQMFPGVLLILPYFIVMRWLGLINTYWALILAYTSFALPLATWSLRGYFASVSSELDQAALVDGCTRLGALVRVVLPVSLPGLSAVMILVFILAWSEYLFALVLTTDRRMQVLTVGLGSMLLQYGIEWNQLMALGVIAIVPIVGLFLFLERFLVSGLTAGAVKG